MLIDQTIQQFIAATASGDPVPGGGSISALCGALSAALGSMVGRLTLGKKKYADVQPQIQEIVARLEPIPQRLAEAVDQDSEAYDRVFQAYKLPKDTDEQRQARADAIQTAMKHAASVPLGVAMTVAETLPALKELALKGNQNAITDAYVATLCARTAILGACANVRINLGSIDDQQLVQSMRASIDLLQSSATEAEAKITAIVNQALA